MFERRRRKVPELNTTSTADISFMLLIFFLVTSSMDSDLGLPRQLPPPPDEQVEQELTVKERNVLQIEIDAHDQLTCGGEPVSIAELTDRIARFVTNEQNDPAMPEKSRREVNLLGLVEVSDRHVIAIQVDRETTYDAYFQMQNAIVRAYARLRNQLALKHFGHSLRQCSPDEQASLAIVYPQRISETPPREQGARGEEQGAAGREKGGAR